MTTSHKVKLPEGMPRAMRQLPRNTAGYPIPFFVEYVDGTPDFRIMSGKNLVRAVNESLCWLCGEPLHRTRGNGRRPDGTFVAGPMCLVNRNSAEPPSHEACAAWAVRACPFLVNPNRERRSYGVEGLAENIAGISFDRNPGVTGLIHSTAWTPYQADDGGKGVLFRMDKIDGVEWIAGGRPALVDEVLHSLDTGLPALSELAAAQEGARHHLTLMLRRAMTFIDASPAQWGTYRNIAEAFAGG